MVLHLGGHTRAFVKCICITALAAVLPLQPGMSLLLLHGRDPPLWITQALASGELDQKTVDLLRRPLNCQPSACPATWSRAMNWLKSNSLSIETMPDFGNDIFRFKIARGTLKKFPEVKITVRMKTWTVSSMSEIEIEHNGHELDAGLGRPEQLIQDAKIFADFKSYLLKPSDNDKP